MEWDNVGDAPPYFDYRVALRFRTAGGESAVVVTEESIRGWLPGHRTVAVTVPVPGALSSGFWKLQVGLVEPGDQQPAAALAVRGGGADRWYPLGQIEIIR